MAKPDMDVITAVPRGLNVIKNFVRDDSALRKLINLEEELMLHCGEDKIDHVGSKVPDQTPKKSPCDSPHADPCTDLCSRPKASVTLEELSVPRPLTKPYKNSVVLGENTIVGRAFPIKFRVRRRPGNCKECGMKKKILCTPTENTNVVLLSNCCDVMVWPSKKIEEMDKVPVTLITGIAQLTEYILEETTVM